MYGPGANAFSLTERAIRGRGRELAIGESTMAWDGADLVVHIAERTTPWGQPIRGSVRLTPECAPAGSIALDGGGAHRWWPVAPVARIAVNLSAPALRFEGHGYHDANAGSVPLEASFSRWSWSRARLSGGRAAVVYDCKDRSGVESRLAEIVDAHGHRTPLDGLSGQPLAGTRWGLSRTTRAEGPARVVRALEDGPFYARALVATRIAGEPVVAMHEELSLDRLARGWVRFLAGFRMRRA